jgi:hypothetical protein
MISDKRIVASDWAIAGDRYPGGETDVSPIPFEARVAAAAEAG